MDKYGVGQDPYCYKGTATLRNKLGIKDPVELEKAEKDFSFYALEHVIEFEGPPYNLAYLCNIHRQLFEHVYDWAGKVRHVKITKKRTEFCIPERVIPEAERCFRKLADSNNFLDLEFDDFIEAIAHLYSDINVVHPFREGNGRAQRILFEHIALYNGYHFDWNVIDKAEWIDANEAGYFGDDAKLVNIFRAITLENDA
ncbi:Fic/DOC family protein [Vibrio fluvialis]|uniref:Fic/DOC family protein n=1 Tax=Vibrio fluvialis TaxID=676 RepID=UPI002B25BE2B|nr:Fic family protein [Vibrio fluvialis]WPK54085.1 Fic family protein [Vibrio fluvialis]